MAEFFLMPQSSPTMQVGRLVEWRVQEGDKVKSQDVLAEIETDKATMEIVTFDPGFVLKILQPAGTDVPVDTPIAIIGSNATEDVSALLTELETTKAAAAAPTAEPEPQPEPRIKAGPAARKAAAELGVTLESVSGTGRGGRILREDVENAKPKTSTPQALPEAGLQSFQWNNETLDSAIMEPFVSFQPDQAWPKRRGRGGSSETPRADEVIPNSMMRQTIARRLKESYLDAPVFFLNAKYQCDNLVAFRKQLKDGGIKVSYNDILVLCVAKALRDVPAVNASWSNDSITRHGQVNVGVAVALPDGLITPVIRQANTKTLSQISTETRELVGKARDKKLTPEEYSGSTFTISNLGMMGIEHFTAIINPPNAAILAAGAMQQEPVVVNGQLSVGWRMKLTMTCDHRVIDGALGAEFLQALRKYLENPILLNAW